MRKTLLTAALAALTFAAFAQENREADSLRYRYGRQQVSATQRKPGTKYADTLDTGNPGVKVVLYSNGTYRYVKDPSVMAADSVFTEFWDTKTVNPYRETPDAIPDRFSIWVVDSLDSYACPNQTTPRSQFGYRHGRRHQGIDLPYPTGTPVPAAFDGKVRISDYIGGYGNLVVIRHANGLETFYAHLSRRDVNSGDWVSAGDIIGLGGSTGRSTGPHLHFETRYKGAAFDPAWLIDFDFSRFATGISIPTSAMCRKWTTRTRYSVPMRKTASLPKSRQRKRLRHVPRQRLPQCATTPYARATPSRLSPASITLPCVKSAGSTA